MSDWTLVYQGYEPDREGLREALCTLGNGYLATRGAAADAIADGIHYPGTYLAGGYDRARSEIGGRQVENEDLVNFPNWLPLTFRVGEEEWFGLDSVEILAYRLELNLRDGLLLRDVRFRDFAGRTSRWTEQRMVSMDQPHLAAISLHLAAEDWEGRVRIRSGIDGRVVNDGVERYRELEGRHIDVLAAERVGDDRIFLRSRTRQSRVEMAQVARTSVYRDGEEIDCARHTDRQPGWVAELVEVDLAPQRPVQVEKITTHYTSRDRAISEAGSAAQEAASRAGRFEQLREGHRRAWHHLWDNFDLTLDLTSPSASVDAQLKLRVHTFHLLQTVSPHSIDRDVGVPARGWHGEAYRGHIFWDEVFIFPLLTYRMPFLTRGLLMYRHRRLPAARRAARDAGLRGAMFPWQSGSDGREESQKLHLNPKSGRWVPDNSHRQRHIGSAIAYNAWHYHQITDDHDFLYFYGAELILEVARFWASVASYDPVDDRYDIRGVMGPDEYHTAYAGADPEEEGGLDNNAYTNVMAAWVLNRARDVLEMLPEHRCRTLREDLDLSTDELDHWQDIARKLRLHFHGDGILSQFAGYEALEDLDWEKYEKKYGDVQRLDRILEAEEDTPNRYKASKQADVLMLFYLFSSDELRQLFEEMGYRWDDQLIPRNIEYYLERTSHGSTLSWVTHAWVMARSDRPASWSLFCSALDSDIGDIQGGTTPEGIHVGAMAGTVDLVHRCYTGIESRGSVLHFNPVLPREVERIEFHLRYRRQVLDIEVTQRELHIRSRSFAALPITVAYRGHYRELSPGEEFRFRLLTQAHRDRAADQTAPQRRTDR